MNINFKTVAIYFATAASFASLAFSLNAQTRLGRLEYEVNEKHTMVMSISEQAARRLNALEGLGQPPSHSTGGYFE